MTAFLVKNDMRNLNLREAEFSTNPIGFYYDSYGGKLYSDNCPYRIIFTRAQLNISA